jgi:predicted GNAT family N-acyltransferase
VTALLRPPVIGAPLDGPDDHLKVVVARTIDDLLEVVTVRAIVYMGEQHCPYDEEIDGNDFAGSTHLLLKFRRHPIGALRVRWFADFAKFERAAIIKRHRGRNASRALILAALELARRKGYRRVLGHAQSRLVAFWTREFGARVRENRPLFAFSDHEYVEIEWSLEPSPGALNIDSNPLVLLRPEGDWDRPGVLDRSAVRPASNPTS